MNVSTTVTTSPPTPSKSKCAALGHPAGPHGGYHGDGPGVGGVKPPTSSASRCAALGHPAGPHGGYHGDGPAGFTPAQVTKVLTNATQAYSQRANEGTTAGNATGGLGAAAVSGGFTFSSEAARQLLKQRQIQLSVTMTEHLASKAGPVKR